MAGKSLGDLYVSLSARTESFTQGFMKAAGVLTSFESRVEKWRQKNEAELAFVGQAFSAVARFVAESVTAFLEAEKASMRLESALVRVDANLAGGGARLEEWADATERATGIDGDYIKSLEQLALQLNVAPNLVNRATQAALDWAEATGGSAKQGLTMLTTASAENASQLAKWGIQIDGADVQARGFTAVLESVEKQYGGTAGQISDTSKALAASKAAWGDLKEAVGQTAVELLRATHAAGGLTTYMDALTEYMTRKQEYSNAALAEQNKRFEARVNILATLTGELRGAEQALENMRGTADEGTDAWARQAAQVEDLTAQLQAANRQIKEFQGISTANQKIRLPEMDLGTPAREHITNEEKALKRRSAAILNQTVDELNDMIDALSKANVEIDMGRGLGLERALQSFAGGVNQVEQSAWGVAAERSRRMADEVRRRTEEIQGQYREAFAQMGGRLVGALGDFGQFFTNVMQAGATAGPAGAIASVAVDLLSKSKTFQQMVSVLSGILQKAADSFGALLEPLIPWLGAVDMLITPLVQLGSSMGALVTQALEPITPIVVLAASVLQALVPVLTLFMQASLMVQQPLMALGGPILKGLFDELKFVGLLVLHVAKAIAEAWNGIVRAIQSVFRSLADISVFGAHPLGFLDGWADSLGAAKVDMDAMAKSLAELTGLSYELALAKAKEHAATLANADALKKTNQELSNVPQRWRRALRTAQSEDRQGPPGASGPGSGTPGLPPGAHDASPGLPSPVHDASPATPVAPVGVTVGGIRFGRRSAAVGATAAPTMGPSVINIIGYEIGPALEEAERRMLRGSAQRSYSGGGSVSSAAAMQFGSAPAPVGG
jgi:hypothetical protein